LDGKIALITGGGTGIGRGIARRFAREGMTVAVAGLDQARSSATHYGGRNLGGYTAAKLVAKEIGGGAIALEADVTDRAQVQSMVAEAAARFGRVDVLVNSAGVITARPIAEMSEDDWDSIMDVNAKGTFLTNQAAVAQMRKQGGPGRIINIASVAGKFGTATLTHYCASKFAVVGFTNALAKEVAREGITVNCICPGIVDTQMWTLLNSAFANPGETPEQVYRRAIERYVPQNEPQTEEDMADMAVFFATAPHVTGQAYNVDGGMDL
jgi:meso-butanediol dehydrogenase/(S,S)-butanediol dehydrogenase/diacetyl reductase